MCMTLHCLIILGNFAWIIPSFYIPVKATGNILITVSSALITKVTHLILLKVPKTYVTYGWHQCSVSDKLGAQHISESLTPKIEPICGLCSHTFDFTFVSYPATSNPDCSVSLISPIHDLSLPQNVKFENFISNERIFFHIVPRVIKQLKLSKSYVLDPRETSQLNVPICKHILTPNTHLGFIILISSVLSFFHSHFRINMLGSTSVIEVYYTKTSTFLHQTSNLLKKTSELFDKKYSFFRKLHWLTLIALLSCMSLLFENCISQAITLPGINVNLTLL